MADNQNLINRMYIQVTSTRILLTALIETMVSSKEMSEESMQKLGQLSLNVAQNMQKHGSTFMQINGKYIEDEVIELFKLSGGNTDVLDF